MFVPLFLYFMESLHQAGASNLKMVLIWSSFTMVEKLQFETEGEKTLNLTSRYHTNQMKKKIQKLDLDWILWGRRQGEGTDRNLEGGGSIDMTSNPTRDKDVINDGTEDIYVTEPGNTNIDDSVRFSGRDYITLTMIETLEEGAEEEEARHLNTDAGRVEVEERKAEEQTKVVDVVEEDINRWEVDWHGVGTQCQSGADQTVWWGRRVDLQGGVGEAARWWRGPNTMGKDRSDLGLSMLDPKTGRPGVCVSKRVKCPYI